jgi:hypothetical protein
MFWTGTEPKEKAYFDGLSMFSDVQAHCFAEIEAQRNEVLNSENICRCDKTFTYAENV